MFSDIRELNTELFNSEWNSLRSRKLWFSSLTVSFLGDFVATCLHGLLKNFPSKASSSLIVKWVC